MTREEMAEQVRSLRVATLKEWRLTDPSGYAAAARAGYVNYIVETLGLYRDGRGGSNRKEVTEAVVREWLREMRPTDLFDWRMRKCGQRLLKWCWANGLSPRQLLREETRDELQN